ncbi:MAG: nucleotidyltransferase domain-containing protein [Sphaerochaetaceae bacterium]|nr:nucleotidyltransferase domain-containing protein [Sphaerochaetaceae bacterium]
MNVKQIRHAANLTQKQFSEKYCIPLKTLQNWETDSSLPSYRECPQYVLLLLEKAVKSDFPMSVKLLNANIDERHMKAIKLARTRIAKSPLSKYVIDVYLYGSTARGAYKDSSDIDILLVLDEEVKKKKKYGEWITYLKGNISSDDFNIPEADLHVAFGKNWKDNRDAYFSNIKEEGFSIWN